MACPSLDVPCVATLHVMRKFNWSFNLNCNFAVPCGALQNYGNVQSTVIWKRMCLSLLIRRLDTRSCIVRGQHYSIKFGEELVLFAKGGWWSSGVVVLPGTHYLVVQFEQANVKKFQLHNMGKEAERYVGVVSLSPPFYRNLATRYHTFKLCNLITKLLGEICRKLLHSKFWNAQFFSHLFIIVGLSLHFQYSGHIVKAVSYQYRSPSVSCARLKRFRSRRQFRQGFPCLPWMQPTFALDALVFISLLHDLFPWPYCSSRSIEMSQFLNFYKIVQPKLWCDKW
jgi:hypothetical protein